MKALETNYAGCRFRSRLEARWAVFFDALNIAWQYEPQGFECSWRLMLDSATFPYLPDFWLPELSLWVEVKGSWTNDERWRFLNAAASLSSNDGGGCHDAGGNDVLLLGPIPDCWCYRDGYRATELVTRVPYVLHMHKGELIGTPWDYIDHRSSRHDGEAVATDSGLDAAIPLDMLLQNDEYYFTPDVNDRYVQALRSARSARFEHGESGAMALG